VRQTVKLAEATRTVPVLVAYNIPFRDCAQFSAGGATSAQEYEDWIDGFAAGIGDAKAVVILEPDSLGIIPWYDPYGSADGSSALDWCQPAEANSATAASERFAMLGHAVDALKAKPGVSVYLDGTHSGWLGVGDAAHRLPAKIGVEQSAIHLFAFKRQQRVAHRRQRSDHDKPALLERPGNIEGDEKLVFDHEDAFARHFPPSLTQARTRSFCYVSSITGNLIKPICSAGRPIRELDRAGSV